MGSDFTQVTLVASDRGPEMFIFPRSLSLRAIMLIVHHILYVCNVRGSYRKS